LAYGSINTSELEILNSPENLLQLVCGRTGYVPGTILEPIRERMLTTISRGLDIIHVNFVERIDKIINWSPSAITGEGISIKSSKWSALLNHMESPELIYSFVLSLGEDLDQLIEKKINDSLFDAYILDSLGSYITEYFADCIDNSISGSSTLKGYDWSRRFSPGYCDWELASGQKEIFQFLQTGEIGVRIMPSGAIIPAKSVSAVMIGAGKIDVKSPCRFCKDKGCEYRRID
jgi:hypothetical protein